MTAESPERAEAATASELLVSVEGHVAHVTLNRPHALNSISRHLNERLEEAWSAIDADPDIWAVILGAAGDRAFCAGADVRESATATDERRALGGGLTGIGGPLRPLTTPLIAAVHGYVLGGGFELAMCADVIVAADDASFGLPETKVGIIGEAGVVHRVVRQLPYRVAMGLVLTGERLSADEALRHGLVNEVVPRGDLDAAARSWADRICAASPLAVQAAKDAANRGLGMSLENALATRYEPIERYAGSLDVVEGRRAFEERRPARWSGR